MKTGGKESPVSRKPSKSPISKADSKNWARNAVFTVNVDTDADALRASANELELDHDVAHLSPALQRYWQAQ
jgi:hypothetical protein